MPESVRSSVTNTIAIAAASAVAVTPLITAPHAPPTLHADVSLSALATPPPGALIGQFLGNQIENCSLICPFIVQGAVQVPATFALIPLTFAGQLQSGEPVLQAIALTDATVSGAANAALTGIITNDLGLVLPRAQNALEVGVVGLIEIGITAGTQPGNLLRAVNTARTDLFDALTSPPGTMPPTPVHNALEATAVRVIEVGSALIFQAPERLLLGVTQATNTFFSTLGSTGNVRTALGATGASVRQTANESVGFIRHALTEPIPITPKPTTAKPATTPLTTTITPKPLTKKTSPQPLSGVRHILRPSTTAGAHIVSAPRQSTTQPLASVHKVEHSIHRALNALTNHHRTTKKAGS